MKTQLLFLAFAGLLTGCQRETDIQPGSLSLAGEAAGNYRTNFYLDPSCVAIPAEQMPFAEVKAESEDRVTIVYTSRYPTTTTQRIEHILVAREAESIQLRIADSVIGILQIDRIFTNNGMEKKGQLLRINALDNPQLSLSFIGYKQ